MNLLDDIFDASNHNQESTQDSVIKLSPRKAGTEE